MRDGSGIVARRGSRRVVRCRALIFGWSGESLLRWRPRDGRVLRRSFCLHVTRAPIGGRKCDAPESRRRMFKFDANFAFAGLIGADIDDAADEFLLRFVVLDGDQVSGLDRKAHDQ